MSHQNQNTAYNLNDKLYIYINCWIWFHNFAMTESSRSRQLKVSKIKRFSRQNKSVACFVASLILPGGLVLKGLPYLNIYAIIYVYFQHIYIYRYYIYIYIHIRSGEWQYAYGSWHECIMHTVKPISIMHTIRDWHWYTNYCRRMWNRPGEGWHFTKTVTLPPRSSMLQFLWWQGPHVYNLLGSKTQKNGKGVLAIQS